MYPALRSRKRFRRLFAGAALSLCVAAPAGALSEIYALSRPGVPWSNRLVRDGIALEVEIGSPGGAKAAALRQGERVALRFRISDAYTGQPFDGLVPAARIEPVPEGQAFDEERCTEEAEGAGGLLGRLGEREDRPGTYEAVTRLAEPGRYQVVFFLDSPRIVHCFQMDVKPRWGRVASRESR